jgi:hypothetical protein
MAAMRDVAGGVVPRNVVNEAVLATDAFTRKLARSRP